MHFLENPMAVYWYNESTFFFFQKYKDYQDERAAQCGPYTSGPHPYRSYPTPCLPAYCDPDGHTIPIINKNKYK